LTAGGLVCRSCATTNPAGERFCPQCGLPLVHPPGAAAGARPLTDQQERARKVRAEYAQGELVTVSAARNQAEAELIQGLLLEEGIPSLVRRTGGFDVPDFLAAGPRNILVPLSGEQAARDVLGTSAPREGSLPRTPSPAWVQALAVVLVVALLVSIAAAVGVAVLR
jgi:hypothetical protein